MGAEMITGMTRGGAEWTPEFIIGLNQERCIGCGRCYKVCPRNVFDLVERELDDDDDDDDFSDDTWMGMPVADALDCIGGDRQVVRELEIDDAWSENDTRVAIAAALSSVS